MTGSVALDVVIGLVFIYLLYSLLATIICEIIAVHLGLRARNLQQAMRRMLEDSPQTSENKIIAFLKHVKTGIINLFTIIEGPATCVFYHLPVIKYLGRNTFDSKPSYITHQNFSKGIIEIFRHYGGPDDKPDLEKIQNVLKGALQYPGILKTIKDHINAQTRIDPAKLDKRINYTEIRASLAAKVESEENTEFLDIAQRTLLRRIMKLLRSKSSEKRDKAVVYKIDEMLNLFGHETRSHLLSLLKDAENDVSKFRLLLEQWFDDTMKRATGWYKQKVQFILLLVGLGLAICFNANTISMIKRLSVDKGARDMLVFMSAEYTKDPAHKSPEGLVHFTSRNLQNADSVRLSRLDSLEKIRLELQSEMRDANSLLGLGWRLPDSLELKEIGDKQLLSGDNGSGYRYNIIQLQNGATKLLQLPRQVTDRIFWSLTNDAKGYTCTNRMVTKIDVDNSNWGRVKYAIGNVFSNAFWGYLLTALAISLGSPFWFDILNKLVQIRGSVKEPPKSVKN
jgi:hypothetical protein